MSTNQDKWTSERCFLGDAYPHFVDWAESRGVLYNVEKNGSHLYSAGYPDCDDNDADGALRFYDDNGNSIPTGAASSECLPIDKTAPDQTESDPSEPKRTMENGDPLPDDLEIVEDIEGNSSSVINNGNNGNNGGSGSGSGGGSGSGSTISINKTIGYNGEVQIPKSLLEGATSDSKLVFDVEMIGSSDGWLQAHIYITINHGTWIESQQVATIWNNFQTLWTGTTITYTIGSDLNKLLSGDAIVVNGSGFKVKSVSLVP
jgi:hypothetical protein